MNIRITPNHTLPRVPCAAFMACIVLICTLVFSCNDSPPGGALGIDATDVTGSTGGKSNGSTTEKVRAPKLVSITVTDGTHIAVEFSARAVLRDASVGSVQSKTDVLTQGFTEEIACAATADSSGTVHTIELAKPTQNGVTYALRGTVCDEGGNTLMFGTAFSGFNDRVPRMVLSEVQAAYSKPKAEFVELYIQSDGNLGGVCIYSVKAGVDARYEFPPIEVRQGDFVVVHFRRIEENCIDETGEDLALSEGTYSSPAARDLWIDSQKALLGRTDVILLEERKNGKVLDALLLCESKKTDWPKSEYAFAARRAVNDGAWLGGYEVESAFVSDKLTSTRSASRQGDLQTAEPCGKESWIVTATSNATPGEPNSSKQYVGN